MKSSERIILNVSDKDLLRRMGQAEERYMLNPEACADSLIQRIHKPTAEMIGAPLPWGKVRGLFGFRPGEITIWSGYNGHGKSQIMGQVMSWVAPFNNVAIASFEMLPELTLTRMMRQIAGSRVPSEEYIRKVLRYLTGKLYIYDQRGPNSPERMLAATGYFAEKYEVKHMVIDSLMKCGMAPDDYVKQKDFVDRLTEVAELYGIHIHLVAHMRKPENGSEGSRPSRFSVSGHSDITNLAHNVLVTWRNKPKEKRVNNGEADPELEGEPDQLLMVDKQRNGEWEGQINLWYHRDSFQYTPDPRNLPMPYVDEVHHVTLSDEEIPF